MKTVEISEASPELANLFAQARDQDLVVRLPDGREFLLVSIDEFDLEVARRRANSQIMALLDARARSTATLSIDEARGKLLND